MIEIALNTLIEWIADPEQEKAKKIERVLHISSDGEEIIVIDVIDRKALPFLRSREVVSKVVEIEKR